MAGQITTYQIIKSFKCAASSGIDKYLCVTAASNLAKLPAATPEQNFIGVAQDTPDQNLYVPVLLTGVAVCISDGTTTIAIGDKIIMGGGADGKVAGKGLADGTTVYPIIGKALTAAANVAGTQVEVLLGSFNTPLT